MKIEKSKRLPLESGFLLEILAVRAGVQQVTAQALIAELVPTVGC